METVRHSLWKHEKIRRININGLVSGIGGVSKRNSDCFLYSSHNRYADEYSLHQRMLTGKGRVETFEFEANLKIFCYGRCPESSKFIIDWIYVFNQPKYTFVIL